jgi:hypothetical protein
MPSFGTLRRPAAAKRVSADARGRLASLDWKAICGMRDVLIHDYIGVDLDEVWNFAYSRIPEIQAVLEQFLAGEGPSSRRPDHCPTSPLPSHNRTAKPEKRTAGSKQTLQSCDSPRRERPNTWQEKCTLLSCY